MYVTARTRGDARNSNAVDTSADIPTQIAQLRTKVRSKAERLESLKSKLRELKERRLSSQASPSRNAFEAFRSNGAAFERATHKEVIPYIQRGKIHAAKESLNNQETVVKREWEVNDAVNVSEKARIFGSGEADDSAVPTGGVADLALDGGAGAEAEGGSDALEGKARTLTSTGSPTTPAGSPTLPAATASPPPPLSSEASSESAPSGDASSATPSAGHVAALRGNFVNRAQAPLKKEIVAPEKGNVSALLARFQGMEKRMEEEEHQRRQEQLRQEIQRQKAREEQRQLEEKRERERKAEEQRVKEEQRKSLRQGAFNERWPGGEPRKPEAIVKYLSELCTELDEQIEEAEGDIRAIESLRA